MHRPCSSGPPTFCIKLTNGQNLTPTRRPPPTFCIKLTNGQNLTPIRRPIPYRPAPGYGKERYGIKLPYIYKCVCHYLNDLVFKSKIHVGLNSGLLSRSSKTCVFLRRYSLVNVHRNRAKCWAKFPSRSVVTHQICRRIPHGKDYPKYTGSILTRV